MAIPNTKIVNIKATIPIRDTTPPIYGVKTNVKMTHSDILKCLCRRAIVEEVLPDGSTVRLTTKNFRDDFASTAKVSNDVKKSEPKMKDIDLAAQITEKADEEDHNEPEEAKNVNTILHYADESAIAVTGVAPAISDDEDETHVSDSEEEEISEEKEVEEEPVTEEAPSSASVNTISTPIDTSVKKKSSSKKNSKKK